MKMGQYFPKQYEPFGVEILILKLIYLIMQQNQIPKIFHILILQVLN